MHRLEGKELRKKPKWPGVYKKNVCVSEKEMTDAGKAERVSRMFLSNTDPVEGKRKESLIPN